MITTSSPALGDPEVPAEVRSAPSSPARTQSFSPAIVELVEPRACRHADGHLDRDVLFSQFQPLVRRLIRQYGGDLESRQELEGEIYVRFSELLAAYDPGRGIPLRPYLVRSLTASVYTYARSRWRREQREVSSSTAADLAEACEATDPTPDWDHGIVTRQVQECLPQLIGSLPARQRQVVIWRYYESRSFEEIAELLNVRVATCRSLLRHGLNNLRKQAAAANLVHDEFSAVPES